MPARARPTPQGLLVLVGSLLSPPFGDLTNAADGVRGTSPVSQGPRRRESLSGAVREGSISPEISGAESPAGQPSPAASVRGRAEPRCGADAAVGTWPAVRRDGSRQGVPTRGCRPPRAAPWAQRPPSLLGQAVPAGPCPPAAPGMGDGPLSPELHLVFRPLCLTILPQSNDAIRAREPPPRGLRPGNPKEKTHRNGTNKREGDSKQRGPGVCDDAIRKRHDSSSSRDEKAQEEAGGQQEAGRRHQGTGEGTEPRHWPASAAAPPPDPDARARARPRTAAGQAAASNGWSSFLGGSLLFALGVREESA